MIQGPSVSGHVIFNDVVPKTIYLLVLFVLPIDWLGLWHPDVCDCTHTCLGPFSVYFQIFQIFSIVERLRCSLPLIRKIGCNCAINGQQFASLKVSEKEISPSWRQIAVGCQDDIYSGILLHVYVLPELCLFGWVYVNKKIVAILQDLNVIYNCISTTERTIIEIENELLVTTHIQCVYFLMHGNNFTRGHMGSFHEIRKLRNLATCGAKDPYVTWSRYFRAPSLHHLHKLHNSWMNQAARWFSYLRHIQPRAP